MKHCHSEHSEESPEKSRETLRFAQGDKYHVAVVGASGAVGQEMISILESRRFPVSQLLPLASERSLGKTVQFQRKKIPLLELDEKSFAGVDIAFFSAGGEISRTFAPLAAEEGAVVIDNTSAFRLEPNVPLVVPEVNPSALNTLGTRRIIANPNCSTIQLVMTLAPLHREATIKRVVVATYQSSSGAGTPAMEELREQSRAILEGRQPASALSLSNGLRHGKQIAFNCIPHIDVFEENGYTREEMKLTRETVKIMEDSNIHVVATAVRVPVFIGHSEAVFVEFSKALPPERARKILSASAGISVIDDPRECSYPLAIDAAGTDPVYVGRIRRDVTVEHGLSMWIVADNLRKGAALNAVQIAELLLASPHRYWK